MPSKNYFINGITEVLILSILKKQDSYVYDIVKSITELSGGLLNISQNTIYTATYKLGNESKISEYSKLVGKRRTRVYYHLEPAGEEYLNEIMNNYLTITTGIDNLLNALSEKGESENE